MRFQIKIKNPKDFLTTGTTISGYIQDVHSNRVFSAAADLTN